jgi:hypothetical protein
MISMINKLFKESSFETLLRGSENQCDFIWRSRDPNIQGSAKKAEKLILIMKWTLPLAFICSNLIDKKPPLQSWAEPYKVSNVAFRPVSISTFQFSITLGPTGSQLGTN